MNISDLALARAGFSSLADFQKAQELFPSGRLDLPTMERLRPYLLGYVTHRVQPGESLFSLAQRYGSTVQALATANGISDPKQLPVGQRLTVPLNFPIVPTDRPFTSELLSLCIQGLLARYPFLSARVLTATANRRPVYVLKIGKGSRSLLYNAAHHANEWITTPLLMKFLEDYALACSTGGRLCGMEAAQLLTETQLYLVPMVNPDGVDLVTGAIAPGTEEYARAEEIAARYPAIPFPEGWKANLQGVDLNLNYPAGWEQARENKFALGYRSPAPRDFVGFAPLDQPESLAMTELTRQVAPRLTLSYHAQGEVIYWKYLDMTPEGARRIGEEFARVSGYFLEDTPYASGFAGYKDWFILRENRPGYTVEVGKGTNPLPLAEFPTIYEKNLGILTLALRL